MICISVTPTSRKLAKADLVNASRYADMVELCLDYLLKEPDVGEMLQGIDKPILVSCRRPQDGGQFQGTEEQRLGILRQAIVAGPAYVELDLDTAKTIPRFGEAKRVISYTSLDRPLGKIDDIFERAYKADADVVKFTWPTPTLNAAWPLLVAVTQKREVPVVGMGLGPASLMFSLLGRKYGSPWVYAALEKGMEAHEGQATVWELNEVFHCHEIGPQTRFVGVVGFGPAEIATMRVLNAGYQERGFNMRCLPLQLGPLDKLEKMLDVLKINALLVSPQLGSFLLEFAGQRDDAVTQCESADLFLKQPDGWHAYSTLWQHGLKALEDTLGKTTAGDRPLDRRNVLILGAGGLAQALTFGICRRNCVLSICAPDDKQAKKIAQTFNVRHVPFAGVYDALAEVVIVADPSLVMGHHKTEVSPSLFRPNMTVMDVSRLPEETQILHEARARGCRIVEPTDVFARQVASQFKSLTGQDLPSEADER